jgi:hypothetical protein
MSSFEIAKIENFVSAQEQHEMRETALALQAEGILQANPRGPGRFRAKIWGTEQCTPFIHAIGNRVIEHFGLTDCPVDPQLGWIISLLEPGACIHPHVDRYPYHEQSGTKHLRCNIMVSRDNASGNPVLAGNILEVPERTLWGFFPSEVVHYTQLIRTSKPRIAYQFGFMVPEAYSLSQQGTKKGAPKSALSVSRLTI